MPTRIPPEGAIGAIASPLHAVRAAIAAGVVAKLGTEPEGLGEYAVPRGDPGLFGPGSLAWRVHADLPAMLIGGISSLMLQTLHPRAMAGVAQHSHFREDPVGRLKRTARYVAGTTFGSVELADELRGEVRRAHAPVRGTTPGGERYSASDPDLVTWVHTTEVWSFLRSYQRYATRPLTLAERDRYLYEVALLGFRLGAREVPTSVAEVRRYLAEMRPSLSVTPEALEAVSFLRQPVGGGAAEAVAHRILCDAAIDLLPDFARRELGIGRVPLVGPGSVRGAAVGIAIALRWAMGPSVIAQIASDRAKGTSTPIAPWRSAAAKGACDPRRNPTSGERPSHLHSVSSR